MFPVFDPFSNSRRGLLSFFFSCSPLKFQVIYLFICWSPPRSPLFFIIPLSMNFPIFYSKQNQFAQEELWISLFLCPSSPHEQGLCATAPEMGARTMACFSWNALLVFEWGNWAVMVSPWSFHLALLAWNLHPTSKMELGLLGPSTLGLPHLG